MLLLAAPSICATSHADVAGLLGAGNMSGRDAARKYAVLAKTGLSMTRIPFNVGSYWDNKLRLPRLVEAEATILAAHRHGVQPVILFEYYTRSDGDITHYDFKAIGRAYAERFRPNSPWLKPT